MKSMTGFGRAEGETPFGKLVVEIHSVNRKYLELHLSLPKEFSRFEMEIRKMAGEFIHRGTVSIRLHLQPNTTTILPDASLLLSLKKGWEKLAKELGYPKESVDFPFLMKYASELPQGHAVDEQDFKPISALITKSLKALDVMKDKEGAALAKDTASRLKAIAAYITEIEKTAPDAVAKMRLRLQEKMEEHLKASVELDDRLLREVALYAERLDISEEITRFRSHIAQFEKLMKETLSGRKLEFLVQEMGREINTIGSKSMDSKISHLVVEVKSELEKVREQNQNIE